VTDMRDELLERVVDELQSLPPVDEAAVGRIMRAAAADAAAARGARSVVRGGSWWQSSVPLAAAAGFALVAGLAGYAVRGGGSSPTVATAPASAESVRLVSAQRAPRTADLAVPTQFVLDAPRAARVALVGDFNAWDAAATPLARVSSSGIWTVTVPLAPGRHTYAFMVDTVLTLDPRAPAARDADFGTPSSVVLVGTP
jgi:predicted carbohydrate-binding protein with CBM48